MKRSALQHQFNALHLYCRLCPVLGRSLARLVATCWERTWLYRALYSPRFPRPAWGQGAGRTATT